LFRRPSFGKFDYLVPNHTQAAGSDSKAMFQ
jgi:hypothetical protein